MEEPKKPELMYTCFQDASDMVGKTITKFQELNYPQTMLIMFSDNTCIMLSPGMDYEEAIIETAGPEFMGLDELDHFDLIDHDEYIVYKAKKIKYDEWCQKQLELKKEHDKERKDQSEYKRLKKKFEGTE